MDLKQLKSQSTQAFLNRLYLGFQAEYYVMGKLFASGFEGFKLPGEFGFDLLATNQMEASVRSNIAQRSRPLPYALQVKSSRIQGQMFEKGPNGRLQAVCKFLIKNSEIKLLSETTNAFLVLVGFIQGDIPPLRNRSFFIWLDSAHVQRLDQMEYLFPHPTKLEHVEIRVGVRLLPSVQLSSILHELSTKYSLSPDGCKALKSLIPDRLPAQSGATEYLSFVRKAKDGTDNYVFRYIPDELQDFAALGNSVSLSCCD